MTLMWTLSTGGLDGPGQGIGLGYRQFASFFPCPWSCSGQSLDPGSPRERCTHPDKQVLMRSRKKRLFSEATLGRGTRSPETTMCIPLIPALGKQRQADLCESEASLVYRASSRTARTTQRNPILKKQEGGGSPGTPSLKSPPLGFCHKAQVYTEGKGSARQRSPGQGVVLPVITAWTGGSPARWTDRLSELCEI